MRKPHLTIDNGIILCIAAVLCLCPLIARGAPADDVLDPAIEEIQEPFAESEEEMEDPQAGEEQPDDACDWELEDKEIQDQSQEVLRSWSCHSFRWFDSWWGDRQDFDESAVNGWFTVGAEFTQYDGIDPRMRLKVRAPLPNLNDRWDLILGRVDEESFVSDTQAQDQTFFNPGIVNRGDDESWLLGLGHRRKSRKKGWDWSAGFRLRLPPQPYTKVSWFYNQQFSERTDLRFRQTFFWRSDEGFGTTSRGDLAHGLDEKNVMRWEAIVKISEETQGGQWYFGQTWYHLLGGRNAFSMLAFIRGETKREVELQDMGFNLIWRRPFTREWLYLSMGPNITWPRRFIEEERELSLGFGLWIEMEFGHWRYR